MWEPIITFLLLIVAISQLLFDYEKMPVYAKVIGIFLVSHLIFYGFAAFMMYNKTNNMLLFHVLRPFNYVLISFFFFEIFESKLIVKIIKFSMILYVVFSLFVSFTLIELETYNSYSILAYNLFLVIIILLYLKELMELSKVESLIQHPPFWIVIGLLFYCVGTTFSEGLMNYLIQNFREFALSFYFVGILLSFFLYASIIVAYRKISKQNFGRSDKSV